MMQLSVKVYGYRKIPNIGPRLISEENSFLGAYIRVSLCSGGFKSGIGFLLEPKQSNFFSIKAYCL